MLLMTGTLLCLLQFSKHTYYFVLGHEGEVQVVGRHIPDDGEQSEQEDNSENAITDLLRGRATRNQLVRRIV